MSSQEALSKSAREWQNLSPEEFHRKRIKARVAGFFPFFILGWMWYVWATGVIALRSHLGISGAEDDVSFGVIATSIGIGSVIGAFLAGPLADRFGIRRVTDSIMMLYTLSLIPLALVNTYVAAAALGVLVGFLRGGNDTIMNAHALRVENLYGRPIMLAFHATIPAGGFAAGLVGSALAGVFTESPLVPYVVMGGSLFVVGLIVRPWLVPDDLPEELMVGLDEHAAEHGAAPGSPKKTTVFWLVGLGFLGLASLLAEITPQDWGTLFVSRERGATPAMAGIAVTMFTLGQFIGRAAGDKLHALFGSRRFFVILAVVAILGLGIIAVPGPPVVALVGFGVFGLGVSSMYPILIVVAGRRDPSRAARNISILNGVGYSGTIVGPIGITAVVTSLGMAWMPVLPAVLLVVVAIMAVFFIPERVPGVGGKPVVAAGGVPSTD